MKRYLYGLFIVALAGCSQTDILGSLFGPKQNTAVLSEGTIDVSSTPQVLVPLSHAEVLGKNSLVCLGLPAGKLDANRSSEELDKLAKTKFLAVVHLSDGHAYDFKCPSILLGKEANSACVTPSCRVSIPRGTEVKSIVVSASQVVHGTRAFWTSIEDVGN